MYHTMPPKFRKNLLALAVGSALTPSATWALALVQEPPLPTSKSGYAAPNVIISVDDSGSMDYCLSAEGTSNCIKNIDNSQRTVTPVYSCSSGYTIYNTDNCRSSTRDNSKRSGHSGHYSCSSGYVLSGNNCYQQDNSKLIITSYTYSCPSGSTRDSATNNCYTWGGVTEETEPVSGEWPATSRRINVLKYSLKKVINDPDLIPENKIRLAWQSLNGTTGISNAANVNSASMNLNSMRPIDTKIGTGTSQKIHRNNFIDFIDKLNPGSSTPTHKMFSQADGYMRRSLSKNSPWSTDPGGVGSKATEYLGCRRNYHIMMTDGRWNGTVIDLPDTTKRDNATDLSIGEGTPTPPTYTGTDSALYRDESSGTTLADWAFYSWAQPLQTSGLSTDRITPSLAYKEAPDTETFGTGTDAVTLKKFWNPKYNPATWPHMVTYTIGFSAMAYSWSYASIIPPTEMAPFGYDGSFPNLAKGTTTWPDLTQSTESKNALDLWHSALNGRGRFYAIERGIELEQAFREIIGKINEESAALPDKITAGGASSGYNISQNNAGLFASVYNPNSAWSGFIAATRAREPEEYACPTKDDPTAKCLKFPDPIAEWSKKTTAQLLDELTTVDNRLILTWSDKWAVSKATGGVAFKWATDDSKLSTAQKSLLGKESSDTTATVATKGENILQYIRGDRSLEGSTDDKPFRVRTSRQGDIVNSDIWYTGGPISNLILSGYSDFAKTQKNRIPMLYVGGNDGMLHGFSAKNGKEQIAYVPRGVIAGLKNLADPSYQHQYYVDGSPMTGDVKDGSTWKTLLVGALGGGGKGYFVLDVTNPAGFATATASSLVSLDRTRGNSEAPDCTLLTGAEQTACSTAVGEDKDIGNITAQPVRNPAILQLATQITRMNNDRWAVVLGNGYNSANQRPVLLVQYLDGSKELKRIAATADTTGAGNANDNGLAAPALVDLDGDGKTDVVYAGDNLGNLWKFDLTSNTDSAWAVAFGNNTPLVTARGPATLTSTTRDQVQPITAPPIVRANDRTMTVGSGENATDMAVGGMMVAFGTGRNLTSNDRRTDISYNVQTLYSVVDNTRYWKNGKTYLQVHPGTGDCGSKPTKCVPTPTPVGTIASDGKPLAKQTITTVSGEFATVTATQELTKATWKDYKGWYVDLPATGERLLKPMQFFDGSNIVAVYTESPSGTKSTANDNINESCVPVKVDTSAGSQWRTLINIMDGKRPTIQLVDTNKDGVFNSSDQNVNRKDVPVGSPLLITGAPPSKRITDFTGGSSEGLNRMPEQSMRPSWRQLK